MHVCRQVGGVSIFTSTAATRLHASPRSADTLWGEEIDASEKWLAIAAPRHPSCIVGSSANTRCLGTGGVRLYTLGATLTVAHFLNPIDINGAPMHFGERIAIDGNTLAVGSPLHGRCADRINDCPDTGAVYIYEYIAEK